MKKILPFIIILITVIIIEVQILNLNNYTKETQKVIIETEETLKNVVDYLKGF